MAKGEPVLAAKIGPARPVLVAKVVRGTNFGIIFCQNWSGWIDFREDRFWCDKNTEQQYLNGTYVSNVTGGLYNIAITYSRTLMALCTSSQPL